MCGGTREPQDWPAERGSRRSARGAEERATQIFASDINRKQRSTCLRKHREDLYNDRGR